MKPEEAIIPKPAVETLTLAATAALHLRNRLEAPRYKSLFDSLLFTPEQTEALLALANVASYHVEMRARQATGGRKGGSNFTEKKARQIRKITKARVKSRKATRGS